MWHCLVHLEEFVKELHSLILGIILIGKSWLVNPWSEKKWTKQKCLILALCCHVWFLAVTGFHFYFVGLANVRPLAQYVYWLNPAPGLSRLRALSLCHDSRGRGSWHHISAALAVSAWSVPMDRLARLTALSQWAVRNGRGNAIGPKCVAHYPVCRVNPPESLFLMHILLPLLLGWQSCV